MTTTLVFDGDCGFCTSSVAWIRRLRLRVDVVIPWQQADLAALGLTKEQCESKLQWVAGDGQVSSGHEAVARLLRHSSPPRRVVGTLLMTRPLSWAAARAYDLVATHRMRLPGGTPACGTPPVAP